MDADEEVQDRCSGRLPKCGASERRLVDWSVLHDRADIAVFQDHLADTNAVVERLLPFDVVCVMRERTPLPRNVLERLSNLKLIASTASGNASIACRRRGRSWNRSGSHGI
jgi:phosphoglycerate dehydrogenase-like enzyme